MTLTLRGRLETRLFLTLAVALPWVLLLTVLLRPHDDLIAGLRHAAVIVALMGALGLGWEFVYHGLQQLRWDRDWPSVFVLAAVAVEIGPLWWAGDRATDRPGTGFFLLAILSAWLVMWAFQQGPMRVLFLRWRLSGGRLSWGLSRHKRALPGRDLGRGDAVTGTCCAVGHVNPPGRVYCGACGAEMAARGALLRGEGPRPVIGALVRGDGVRLPVAAEVALQACSMVPAADGSHTPIRARIVFLGWDPHALAETAGIAWIDAAGTAQVLEPGESVALRPQGRLVLGLDVFCWEPIGAVEAPRRPRSGRRRRRLPDRSLFS